MIVVIPVSASDANLISPFAKAVKHCGKNSGHSAIVVARPSDSTHADRLVAELGDTFDTISTHIFGQDGPSGWPKGPNFYWSSTVHYLQTTLRTQSPWLWCELDCTPLKSGWVDALSTEYNLAKTPFMGVLEETHAVDAEGNPVSSGKHLVGVAVYPPFISSFSTLWPYVPQMPTPFDVVCQWEFVPHTHETKLLQHAFRTQSYAMTNGVVKGQDNNGFPNGIRFDRDLSPDAVLHHGCDDGSLSDYLVGTKVAAKKKPAEVASPAPVSEPEVEKPIELPVAEEKPVEEKAVEPAPEKPSSANILFSKRRSKGALAAVAN